MKSLRALQVLRKDIWIMRAAYSTQAAGSGGKSYEDALSALDTRKRRGRPHEKADSNKYMSVEATNRLENPDFRGTPSIVGMRDWLKALGHTDESLNALNVIHVAGTKGKGSTCAFIESFLRSHGRRTGFPAKTGLYTSPHLQIHEERIRLNFQPLSQAAFAQYFFEVYDTLFSQDHEHGHPRYLQLLAIVALHTFIRESVDVAIVETHHGGEFDSTNIVARPAATVVTTLGMDHVKQLGPTLENIAWHKSGIFRSGVPAFSAPQRGNATEALKRRASERGAPLTFVDVDQAIPNDTHVFHSDVLLTNASLGLAAARSYLKQKHPDEPGMTSDDIRSGVENFSWPGRFQTIAEDGMSWMLDSGHNELSAEKTAQWFLNASQKSNSSPFRVLIYSQMSDQRDSEKVLRLLSRCLTANGAKIHHVIFTTYRKTESEEGSTNLTKSINRPVGGSKDNPDIWKEVNTNTELWYEPTIEKALQRVRSLDSGGATRHVLITGSQHLVGGALELLNWSPDHGR